MLAKVARRVVERKPTVVQEYDYDEDFRHLGYSASTIGSSTAAETELAKIAKRATTVFMCKPGLRGTVAPTLWQA